MGRKEKKSKKSHPEWEKMGFAGLIMTALQKAGGKKKKNKKKETLIKKDYW